MHVYILRLRVHVHMFPKTMQTAMLIHTDSMHARIHIHTCSLCTCIACSSIHRFSSSSGAPLPGFSRKHDMMSARSERRNMSLSGTRISGRTSPVLHRSSQHAHQHRHTLLMHRIRPNGKVEYFRYIRTCCISPHTAHLSSTHARTHARARAHTHPSNASEHVTRLCAQHTA